MIIGLLIFVLTVLRAYTAYAQKDSIIYQEEPIESSDYKPKVFSWSWNNHKNPIIVTPENPRNPVMPHHFTPDIQFYFDGKEFDRRIHKLEEEIDRIQWHFHRDIQKEMNKIKIDTLFIEKDTLVRKIIIEKPHKRKEIIVVPRQHHVIIPPNPPFEHEKRIEIREEKEEKTKQNTNKQDKEYIQELEKKVQQLEKRLEQLEKNNPKQK